MSSLSRISRVNAEKSFMDGNIDLAIKYGLEAMELQGMADYVAAYKIHKAYQTGCRSWYAVLLMEVQEDNYSSVDTNSIKKQYKKMALKIHPDKNQSVAAETAFKYINEAWDVLSDPHKRKLHDKYLQKSRVHRPAPAATSPGPAPAPAPAPANSRRSSSGVIIAVVILGVGICILERVVLKIPRPSPKPLPRKWGFDLEHLLAF